jgi:hypothetical protein
MSDERLRSLERRWRETGAPSDRRAWLEELVKLGRATLADRRLLEHEQKTERLMAGHYERTEKAKTQFRYPGAAVLQQNLEMLLRYAHDGELRVTIVIGQREDGDGDGVAGTPWEREIGYIGRSTGRAPAWLLLPTSRSSAGGALLMDCILQLEIDGSSQWLYPTYDPSLWVWERATGRHLLEPWSQFEHERLVYLAESLGVRAGDFFPYAESLGVEFKNARESLRGQLAMALETAGEPAVRAAIERAARALHDSQEQRKREAAKKRKRRLELQKSDECADCHSIIPAGQGVLDNVDGRTLCAECANSPTNPEIGGGP